MMNQKRLQRLTQQILAHGLDGIALVPGPNMVYISDIHAHLSERPIVLFLPADDDPAIIIPTLEAVKARQASIPDEHIFAWTDDEGYTAAFQQACAHLELSDYLLGVEALHMRVLELELLKRYAPGLTIAHAEPTMTALRIQKDSGEIDAMSRAIKVAESAMRRIFPQLRIGMTEKQIAALLTQALMDEGADAIAFGPIVSTGPNSASPHAVPTDRPLQSGDLLVIDWGVFVDGYPSDITRTFAVGEIDPELQRIYNTVKLANEQGKVVARPGATGQDVDRAAREVIDEAGYGEYFIHRTGHGLGLEVHEPPYMMEGNATPLESGNVFTVEPGIYLPGRGGVRIEDDLVITAEGYRCLTTFPRELMTIGPA
jgi:Xaa-Pro dipeptidase